MSQRLGRYQIIRPLASGGMGDIFLAEHTGLSGFAKRVVVKRIRPAYARDPSYLELFLNEARVGSFLNHPNIVHIFDVGHDGDDLWLVMEYVDGVDLKRLLRRTHLSGRPLAPTALAALMVEVLSALEEAHAGGPLRGEPIIHRDLSPENVLIAKSGAVKVLDFGLAKWSPGSKTVASMEGGLIFGKIRYMPPEQLRGHAIDVRADLFSLGVVMYETLTNQLPFGSDNANAVLAAILAGRPEPATERHPTRDKAMDALIYKAMEPDPGHRFQTASAMRAALVDYLERSLARMPLEQVRRLLRAGEVTSDVDGPLAATTLSREGPAATEDPPVLAKRCGKCGGSFDAVYVDGMIIDRCRSCRGLWFDHAEIQRVMGPSGPKLNLTDDPPAPSTPSRAPLDPLMGSCPSCKVGLRPFGVPGTTSALEVCPRCLGVWFDRDEVDLMTRPDVVSWFRSVIDGMRFSAER
jgi:Zn-finger nucleic acid-binding protein